MFRKLLSHIVSLLLVICCILACNTERFRPKTAVPKVEIPQTNTKPELSIEDEIEEEQIGSAHLDYSDVDESGNGIYGRMISDSFYEKLKVIKAEADPIHKGVLKIICCIDQSGSIMMARPDIEGTSMNYMPLQRQVGKILIDERFEPSTTAPERQCGVVIVEF